MYPSSGETPILRESSDLELNWRQACLPGLDVFAAFAVAIDVVEDVAAVGVAVAEFVAVYVVGRSNVANGGFAGFDWVVVVVAVEGLASIDPDELVGRVAGLWVSYLDLV